MREQTMRTLIALARTLTEPDKIVALATRCGHGGVGTGHYCEFYIAAANRLASTGHIDKGRVIMQAGMSTGHVTWPQMAAWEAFAKYTAEESERMTNFETALRILSEQLPSTPRALAFREWLETRDLVEMGAIGIKLDPLPEFETIRQLFSGTTFHALEGSYHWDTNLLDYFRRRAGDIQWLESLAG